MPLLLAFLKSAAGFFRILFRNLPLRRRDLRIPKDFRIFWQFFNDFNGLFSPLSSDPSGFLQDFLGVLE